MKEREKGRSKEDIPLGKTKLKTASVCVQQHNTHVYIEKKKHFFVFAQERDAIEFGQREKNTARREETDKPARGSSEAMAPREKKRGEPKRLAASCVCAKLLMQHVQPVYTFNNEKPLLRGHCHRWIIRKKKLGMRRGNSVSIAVTCRHITCHYQK